MIFKALLSILLLSAPAAQAAMGLDCSKVVAFFAPHTPASAKEELQQIMEAAILDRNSGPNEDLIELFSYSGLAGAELALDYLIRVNPNLIYDDQLVLLVRLVTESSIQTLNQPVELDTWTEYRGTPAKLSSLRLKLAPVLHMLLHDRGTEPYARLIMLVLDWDENKDTILSDLDYVHEVLDDIVAVAGMSRAIILNELAATPHKVDLLEYMHGELCDQTEEEIWNYDVEFTTHLFDAVMKDPALRLQLVTSGVGEEIANTGLNIRRVNRFVPANEKKAPLAFPSYEMFRTNLRQLLEELAAR